MALETHLIAAREWLDLGQSRQSAHRAGTTASAKTGSSCGSEDGAGEACGRGATPGPVPLCRARYDAKGWNCPRRVAARIEVRTLEVDIPKPSPAGQRPYLVPLKRG